MREKERERGREREREDLVVAQFEIQMCLKLMIKIC